MLNGTKAEVRKGFRLPEKTARITFEGTDYDGAEIQLRLSVSFAQFIALRESEAFLCLGRCPVSGYHVMPR